MRSARDYLFKEFLRKLWRKQAWKPIVLIWLLILIIGGYVASKSPAFLSEFNLNSLLLATLPLALVAMAQVNVLLVGDLDISVGSIMTICVIVASTLVTPDTTGSMVIVGGLAMLLTGVVIGLINAGWFMGSKCLRSLPPWRR
jgi:ribose/xylose/arabinose/galactoside ABC-type transport system permease subunit